MNTSSYPVSDLIFEENGALVDPARFTLDEPVARLSRLRGHFALALERGSGHLLVRDPLGVNKLFFAVRNATLESSNLFVDLVRRGFAPAQIWSVPSGHLARILPRERKLTLEKYSALGFSEGGDDPERELPAVAARIRETLDRTFRGLRRALAGRPIYVTLSGGLDSTTIAALAREHLGRIVAVTFVVRKANDRAPDPESDLYNARRVAEALDIPLQVVETTPEAILEELDDVLVHGQDFRDFNVHCALVNAVLARAIGHQERAPGAGRPVVLTGDTMNELMADYTPVQYGESEYYSLPDLPRGKLRRFLVSGLDSGDREVGVFARHGVDVVQPYAIHPEVYTAVPGKLLDDEAAKQRLVQLVMGERIPPFIYARKKVRAQVAGSNEVGGTMAALLDRGIDSAELERRFCKLVGFEPRELKRWIRAGVYRFTATYPEEIPG